MEGFGLLHRFAFTLGWLVVTLSWRLNRYVFDFVLVSIGFDVASASMFAVVVCHLVLYEFCWQCGVGFGLCFGVCMFGI